VLDVHWILVFVWIHTLRDCYSPYHNDTVNNDTVITHDHLSALYFKNNQFFCNLEVSTIAFQYALMPERSEGISCI
jgi:hypothetical protein